VTVWKGQQLGTQEAEDSPVTNLVGSPVEVHLVKGMIAKRVPELKIFLCGHEGERADCLTEEMDSELEAGDAGSVVCDRETSLLFSQLSFCSRRDQET
jgi:hypothetical protein